MRATTLLRAPFFLTIAFASPLWAQDKIYWADYTNNMIQRSNLDGSQVENIVLNQGGPSGVAMDPVGGKVYWANFATPLIRRANLDGTNMEDLVIVGLKTPAGITLDLINQKMYWTDQGTHRIQRANLDGTDLGGGKEEIPLTDLASGMAVRLASVQQTLYDDALAYREANTHEITSFDAFATGVEERGGFWVGAWCGDAACEAEISARTKATIRFLPLEVRDPASACVHCGKPGSESATWARAY